MMKQLLTSLVFIFTGLLAHSQYNDLDLVNMLIGQDIEHLDSIINLSGYDYTITDIFEDEKSSSSFYTIYIESQYGGIKLWELMVRSPIVMAVKLTERDIKLPGVEQGYIKNINIYYQNANVGDLKDFKSYEVPENDSIIYQKELGRNLSFLKVTYLK